MTNTTIIEPHGLIVPSETIKYTHLLHRASVEVNLIPRERDGQILVNQSVTFGSLAAVSIDPCIQLTSELVENDEDAVEAEAETEADTANEKPRRGRPRKAASAETVMSSYTPPPPNICLFGLVDITVKSSEDLNLLLLPEFKTYYESATLKSQNLLTKKIEQIRHLAREIHTLNNMMAQDTTPTSASLRVPLNIMPQHLENEIGSLSALAADKYHSDMRQELDARIAEYDTVVSWFVNKLLPKLGKKTGLIPFSSAVRSVDIDGTYYEVPENLWEESLAELRANVRTF